MVINVKNKTAKHNRKEVKRKNVFKATREGFLKNFKGYLSKMGGESKAYLLGYGEGYKKKAEEAEKEDERKEEKENGSLQS